MTKNDKSLLVENLSSEFKNSAGIVICDYKGITCKNLERLRNAARDSDAKVKIVKNTLAKIAIKNSSYDDIVLVGESLFIWSDDQITACKVADQFATENKGQFAIKAGILEGKTVDAQTVISMAKMPSRDELIGMLLSVWTAPARNFVTGLDNLRDKLEKAS